MKKKFSILILFIWIHLGTTLLAQERVPWKVDFRTDLYSRHLWRGGQLGDAPAIEPEITLTKGNFGLTVWGATTFNNSYSEIDIILIYKILPFLSISVFDYYNPVAGEDNQYWKFSGKHMRHSFEIMATLEKEDFPLTLRTGMFVYGDKEPSVLKERFSTYAEPGCDFKIARNDFRLFAGFTPFNGYYAEKFAFVNIGATFSDSFNINPKLGIPIKMSLITNPHINRTWFVVSVGIKNCN